MWLLSHIQILTLAVGAAVAEAEPSGNMALPQPISSRQTYFSIPFQVDQPSLPADRAVAVQLHVSTDRGMTWSQYASVPQSQAHFLFRALHDGEYWFGVRTLDRSNQLRPAKIDRPELIVMVDTSPPKLTLQAEHGESGLVTARWQVAEQRLDPKSLNILYRSGPSLPWLTVATEREEADSNKSAWSGDVSWMPVSGPGPLEVRAEIADAAGNRDISYTQVIFNRNLNTLATSASASGQLPASTLVDDAKHEDQYNGWRVAAKKPPPDTYGGTPASPGEGNSSNSSISDRVEHGASSPQRSIAAKSNPPIRNEFTTSLKNKSPLDSHDDSLRQLRSRMVNSTLFELGYDVGEGGQASPARVELWGTRDEGRTWRSYGVDKDGQSPILATVEAEGTYGFRITVSSGRDSIGQPPQPGDLPDMLITVDLTDPVARILSAEQATHNPDGQITVRWHAADVSLAQHPISLYYAAERGGPWNPVAQNLENDGQFEWLAHRNLPEGIYLRIEVRDEAGNVAISETTEPIVLTNRRRAVDRVRQEDESARVSPERYYLR